MTTCPHCTSQSIVRNGKTPANKQSYLCRDCHKRFVENPQPSTKDEALKATVLKAMNERMGLRAAQRVFGVHRNTITKWLKKALAIKAEPPPQAPSEAVVIGLELDEAWSFVRSKQNQCWLWVALERSSRKVLAWVIGDRSADTAKRLWEALPMTDEQKASAVYCTDLWLGYDPVIPLARRALAKGETNHVERFFCTLRQRLARFTRKSLMFSKSLEMHGVALTVFVAEYNKSR